MLFRQSVIWYACIGRIQNAPYHLLAQVDEHVWDKKDHVLKCLIVIVTYLIPHRDVCGWALPASCEQKLAVASRRVTEMLGRRNRFQTVHGQVESALEIRDPQRT